MFELILRLTIGTPGQAVKEDDGAGDIPA